MEVVKKKLDITDKKKQKKHSAYSVLRLKIRKWNLCSAKESIFMSGF